MGLLEILSADHVSVANEAEGTVRSKTEALRRIALLLAHGAGIAPDVIERVLVEREKLQSTGVGGGVAIPHGAIDGLDRQVCAVLLCPRPIGFDAIDNQPVSILFAVIGPKGAAGAHLKTLARISRLLRDDLFRSRLLSAPSGAEAFNIIAAEDGKTGS
jgi:PTS system nitrogen regulatory IIA component